jgi:hypothetical protein
MRSATIGQGCSRPACGGVPAGRLLIDNRARAILIDAHTGQHGGVAVLCAEHLARLRPARGWTVVDLRAERPELFAADPEADEAPTGELRRRRRAAGERPRRPKVADAADQLAFDAKAQYELPESYDRVSRRDGPSPLVRPDANHTPLLARAFEASRRRGEA